MFKRLMQGLYYPAILGTGIVLLMFRIASEASFRNLYADIVVYYAILFSLFFSISFLINEDTPDEIYGIGAFVVDLIEVILVFLCYFLLGLFEIDKHVKPNLKFVYWSAFAVIIVQNVWNYFAGRSDATTLNLSLVVGFVLLISAINGDSFDAFNWIVLFFLFGSLFVYARNT